ncbi:hypothetical protein B0T24DRAFT_337732 [Lasiosphaeria ovina]|uniref:Uncharacterized protein n=1 Tax=Lasiosphaeria ovina TaxID=92902 RepID=A0AAE0K934_9PEZI|nr:hypothetical protein B0T24DRAFT_337732 [Lasiosphaeria ovina]
MTDAPAETKMDIKSIGTTCLNLLESCYYKTQDAELEAKLETGERYFRSWTNKLEVFARKMSLDMQLRSEENGYIREMVLALLDVLRENLIALELALNKNDKAHVAEVEHLLYGVDGCLQRLGKIAHALLESIQVSLPRRIVTFAKKQSRKHGINDSGLDEIGSLAYYVSGVVLERFEPLHLTEPPELADARSQFLSTIVLESPVTGEEEWKKYRYMVASILKNMLGLSDEETKPGQQLRTQGLFSAIVRSCVFRHYMIRYAREKEAQEREEKREPPTMTVETSPIGPTTDMEQERGGQAHTDIKIGAPNDRTQEVQSSGPPTVNHHRFHDVMGDGGSFSMGTATCKAPIAPSEAGHGDYPRPPRAEVVDGVKSGECPICKQRIPEPELEHDSWKRHVDKDILPFVCVLDTCMSELQFFASRESWARHMHAVHTPSWLESLHNGYKWRCSICYTASTSTLSRAEVEDDFVKHVQTNHPKVSDAKLLATICCFTTPQPRDICPICAKTHLEPTSLGQDDGPRNSKAADTAPDSSTKMVRFAEGTLEKPSRHPNLSSVEKCVAQHLKALALYFLNHLLDGTELEVVDPGFHVVDVCVSQSDFNESNSEDVVDIVLDIPASPTADTSGGGNPADVDKSMSDTYSEPDSVPDAEEEASESLRLLCPGLRSCTGSGIRP